MQYQYKILKTDKPEASEEQLDAYGSEGWLLQIIYPWNDAWYYVFVRTKPAH